VPLTETKPVFSAPLIVAIGATADVTDSLDKAVSKRTWKARLLKSDSYISSERRPFFLPALKESEASIVFVDFDKDPDRAADSARYLAQTFPGKITVVALTQSGDSGIILNAMRSGCNEFLNVPLETPALTEIFDRFEAKWLSQRWSPPRVGSLISFLGVKGGVGTTTLAVHLAVYLAQYHHKRTLLIDNHPELGHVCIYLGIDGTRCQFQEVVRNVDRLDSELLGGLVCHHRSGLDVLASPDTVGDVREADGDAMSKAIDFLLSEYDYVIADCGMSADDRNLPFLGLTQQVYLVATPEVAAIRDLSCHIDRFARFDPTLEKVRLVLNRISGSDAIQVEQVEKATRLPISVRIPADGNSLVRAANLGEPAMRESKSAAAARFVRWAEQVADGPQDSNTSKKKKGLFSLWK
jgi:pilus assembly protein CpaE